MTNGALSLLAFVVSKKQNLLSEHSKQLYVFRKIGTITVTGERLNNSPKIIQTY